MNDRDVRYARLALVNEMMESARIAREFDPRETESLAERIRSVGGLCIAGEASSRMFPAGNARRKGLTWGISERCIAEGARQAAQYDLSRYVVICSSNSGRTRETVSLARMLTDAGHPDVYGVTSNETSPLVDACATTRVLRCGPERAVAATKSVVAQAIFFESIIRHLTGRPFTRGHLETIALSIKEALTRPVPAELADRVSRAGRLYIAGYEDGVAEELTLKTNEIARMKSGYLAGTTCLHGVEEVVDARDCLLLIDPVDEECDRIDEIYVRGIGCRVVAISSRPTPFETLLVPDAGDDTPYALLARGWSLLVEIGLALGVDLDKPIRARKVGNEVATPVS